MIVQSCLSFHVAKLGEFSLTGCALPASCGTSVNCPTELHVDVMDTSDILLWIGIQ